jgi:hypothetical protein
VAVEAGQRRERPALHLDDRDAQVGRVQDQLLEGEAALWDDKKADGLAVGYESLLDRVAAGDQLFFLTQKIRRRWTGRRPRPGCWGGTARSEGTAIDVPAGAGPVVGSRGRPGRPWPGRAPAGRIGGAVGRELGLGRAGLADLLNLRPRSLASRSRLRRALTRRTLALGLEAAEPEAGASRACRAVPSLAAPVARGALVAWLEAVVAGFEAGGARRASGTVSGPLAEAGPVGAPRRAGPRAAAVLRPLAVARPVVVARPRA